jgi:hypothetical protein
MKYSSDAVKHARPRRYVHLGERLIAIGRIRSGTWSIDEAARELGATREEVIEWQSRHRDERVMSFDELRNGGSPEALRLHRRASRLAGLIEETERRLRELHQELLGSVQPSKQFVQEATLVQAPSRTRHRGAEKAVISLTGGSCAD